VRGYCDDDDDDVDDDDDDDDDKSSSPAGRCRARAGPRHRGPAYQARREGAPSTWPPWPHTGAPNTASRPVVNCRKTDGISRRVVTKGRSLAGQSVARRGKLARRDRLLPLGRHRRIPEHRILVSPVVDCKRMDGSECRKVWETG
jgi:hypothetical protein